MDFVYDKEPRCLYDSKLLPLLKIKMFRCYSPVVLYVMVYIMTQDISSSIGAWTNAKSF